MRSVLSEVSRRHHRRERGFDRPLRVRQESRDAGQRLVGLGVEDRQDRTNKKPVAGLLPMVPTLDLDLGIDQTLGGILYVPHIPPTAPTLRPQLVGTTPQGRGDEN